MRKKTERGTAGGQAKDCLDQISSPPHLFHFTSSSPFYTHSPLFLRPSPLFFTYSMILLGLRGISPYTPAPASLVLFLHGTVPLAILFVADDRAGPPR